MTSKRTLFLCALLALAALPASAGDAAMPEVTDPEGDVTVTFDPAEAGSSPEAATAADFPEADLLRAWVTEASGAFDLVIQTGADASEVAFAGSFTIRAGPTSVFSSTATEAGETYAFQVANGTMTGIDGAGATFDGSNLTVTIPMAAVNASAGDILGDIALATSITKDEVALPELGALATATGTDDLSNGNRTEYTFLRPPVTGGARIEVISGQDAHFEEDGSAEYGVRVTNTGTDTDTFTVTVANPDELMDAGVNTTLAPSAPFTLAPGDAQELTLTITVSGGTEGSHAATLQVTSTNGANAATTAGFEIHGPVEEEGGNVEEPAEREVIPAGLEFLTPAAEATGLDDALGSYAELTILAAAVLLLILVVVLILFLARSNWVKIEVTPSKQEVRPGRTVEYEVAIHHRKKTFHDALVRFETDQPDWKTGMLLTQDQGATMDPITDPGAFHDLPLTGKKQPGDSYAGTLRVKVPEGAFPKDKASIQVEVVPLDHKDDRRPEKGASARVKATVVPAPPAPEGGSMVRLSDVHHEPDPPHAGETVTTTAQVENDDLALTHTMRVVLLVDGSELQHKVLRVPPRSARAVLFRWRASLGDHEVKVQVFRQD